MTTRIYAKHPPYTDGRLGEVADEIDLAGVPTLRVVEYAGELYAIEGSHRLFLCHGQGIIPKVIVLEPDVEGCEAFFDRARAALPAYDFPYVLALPESAFR